MKTLRDRLPPTRILLLQAGYLAALALGGVQGFAFGYSVSGPLVGVATALSGAMFCALMFGAAADLVQRVVRRGRGRSS
jgi:membrane associated rhomboid family serine protease